MIIQHINRHSGSTIKLCCYLRVPSTQYIRGPSSAFRFHELIPGSSKPLPRCDATQDTRIYNRFDPHKLPEPHTIRLHSSWTPSFLGVITACLLSSIVLGIFYFEVHQPVSQTLSAYTSNHTLQQPTMASELAPGRPGNLTAEEEEKLRQLWQLLLQLSGVVEGGVVPPSPAVPNPNEDSSSQKLEDAKSKKKKMGLFSRKPQKTIETSSVPASPVGADLGFLEDDPSDKYGHVKQFNDAIANLSSEDVRKAIWGMVRQDHPDAVLLRYLRARKWDVKKALIMMVSTMNWRATEMQVDDDLLKIGEAGAIEQEKSDDPKIKALGAGFLAQLRQGKGFMHGVDKSGRPICLVRVRYHRQGDEAEEAVERYIVYLIETARMLLVSPADTATLVFDMTSFSMANMDYIPLKFIIKCFEANYPECLGTIVVYKAPWIFQGIWKVIKGWLDPVVAAKISFASNVKELEDYIPANRIISELDGKEEFEYKYVEPIPGENDKMKDTATRDTLLAERDVLIKQFEAATREWIESSGDNEKAAQLKSQRMELAAKLQQGYWRLDPYIRARSLYDRVGILKPGGAVDYYPNNKANDNVSSTASAAPGAVETSAEDLD